MQAGAVGLHRVNVAVAVPDGVEDDPAAIRRPVAAEVAGRIGGDLPGLAAGRGHDIQIRIAAPVGVEHQPAAIGRHVHVLDGLVARW